MIYHTDKEMRLADPPTTFDNTMLSTFRLCPRKFYWFWRGVEQTQRPAYFAFGTAWQLGLEAWYLTEGDQPVRFEAAAKAARQFFLDEGVIPDDMNNIDKLTWLLMWYTLQYPTEFWRPIPNEGHIELGFRIPLRGTPYYLAGAIDGYISWEPHGFLELENKTTGMAIGGQVSSYMRQWKCSTQVTQYFWALTQILGDLPFGVLMNCASKRITKKDVDLFKNTGAIPEGLFIRDLQKRSARDLEEFESHKLKEIQDLYSNWADWTWPFTTEGRLCAGGTGFGRCPYFILCTSDFYPEEIPNPTSFEGLSWRTESWEPWKRGRITKGDS